MAGSKFLTVLTVLRDGTHLITQSTDVASNFAGVKIGSQLALREKEHGGDVERFIIVHGSVCTEHIPNN